MHVIAAKAVSFKEASQPAFKKYAAQVVDNAKTLAAALIAQGLVLSGGGTDTHLLLVDLRTTNISGKDAEALLDRVGIAVNKNTIPFDPTGPFVTSGIRMGTAAVTTRKMGRPEMEQIGSLIAQVLKNPAAVDLQEETRRKVADLCRRFPLY